MAIAVILRGLSFRTLFARRTDRSPLRVEFLFPLLLWRPGRSRVNFMLQELLLLLGLFEARLATLVRKLCLLCNESTTTATYEWEGYDSAPSLPPVRRKPLADFSKPSLNWISRYGAQLAAHRTQQSCCRAAGYGNHSRQSVI